jgi:hypothetical protein
LGDFGGDGSLEESENILKADFVSELNYGRGLGCGNFINYNSIRSRNTTVCIVSRFKVSAFSFGLISFLVDGGCISCLIPTWHRSVGKSFGQRKVVFQYGDNLHLIFQFFFSKEQKYFGLHSNQAFSQAFRHACMLSGSVAHAKRGIKPHHENALDMTFDNHNFPQNTYKPPLLLLRPLNSTS